MNLANTPIVLIAIENIYRRKVAALYAESKRLAQQAVQELQSNQANNAYWNNQTYQALERIFADAFQDADAVGFFVAHGVEYGVWLEIANDRQHEALRPIVEKYGLILKLFAQELFGSAA